MLFICVYLSNFNFSFEIEGPDDVRVSSILADARKQIEHDQEKLRQVEFAGERPRTRTLR